MLQELELEDAFVDPPSMLGLTESAKAWDLRDRFRALAVDLNPVFVGRDFPEFNFKQVRSNLTRGFSY